MFVARDKFSLPFPQIEGEAGPWDEAVCKGPQHLKDRTVGSLLEEQLICDNNQVTI